MFFLLLYVTGVVFAAFASVFAAWSDVKGMIIPNYLHAVILLGFSLAFGSAYFAGVDVFSSVVLHAVVASCVFVFTFLLFVFRVFGGGDAKIISVLSLWMTGSSIIDFLFYIAIIGGVFGLLAMVIKKIKPFSRAGPESWLGRLQNGEGVVPYAVPISAAFLVMVWKNGYLALETLQMFLVS